MKKTIVLAAFLIAAGAMQASACEWMRQATQEPVTVVEESSATPAATNSTTQQVTAQEETSEPVTIASK